MFKRPDQKTHTNFRNFFNQNLNDFWNPFYGFDIVKFDEWLGTPDGKSTKDFLNEKYGTDASELIKSLL